MVCEGAKARDMVGVPIDPDYGDSGELTARKATFTPNCCKICEICVRQFQIPNGRAESGPLKLACNARFLPAKRQASQTGIDRISVRKITASIVCITK